LTTFPDGFKNIHLDVCGSTNDYLKQNIVRLEAEFPLMVSAAVQTAGRGRESRSWISPENLGIYATFGFHLPDNRGLSLLSIASGVAVIDMLEHWTGTVFALKWPNDIQADGKKVAGILCETIINAEKIICLVGIGINVNQAAGDFPEELRERAGSLRQLTGKEWPVEEGRERLAAEMTAWLWRLAGDPQAVIDRARALNRPFVGKEISFHHQGKTCLGVCRGLAADGGLQLETAGGELQVFYSGEIKP
jgi:BirA family biotin operon repressor/biotin-[acetyl-CoA-carboxylase] ligase